MCFAKSADRVRTSLCSNCASPAIPWWIVLDIVK